MLGAQYGLKPNELLDLSYQELQAYLVGREESQVDQLVMAMQTGYWSGYYQSKKPKPLNTLIKKIETKRSYSTKKVKVKSTSNDAIEEFKLRDAQRLGGESEWKMKV